MKKVNAGHYLELMDRLHILMCTLDEHCMNHPVSKQNRNVKAQLEHALEQLWDAYQTVGSLDNSHEQESV